MVNPISTSLPWTLAQPKLAASLNPILNLPILNGNQINNINLVANTPQSINHLLQRMMQGWFVVDINADTAIRRTLPFNSLTLTLESTSNVQINIWVY